MSQLQKLVTLKKKWNTNNMYTTRTCTHNGDIPVMHFHCAVWEKKTEIAIVSLGTVWWQSWGWTLHPVL